MEDVFVVLDAWGEDPPEVRRVFATQDLAERWIKAQLEHADDYEQSRHHFHVQRREVVTEDRP